MTNEDADRLKNVKPAGTLEDLAARQRERGDLIAFAASLREIPESLTNNTRAPRAAREILQKFGSISLHDADAAAIFPLLAQLDAGKLGALIERMSRLSEVDNDPAFSLAVAKTYFQRISSLVSAILSPLNKAEGDIWRKHLEEYEKFANLAELEEALLRESAKRDIDMPRVTAIAEVIHRHSQGLHGRQGDVDVGRRSE